MGRQSKVLTFRPLLVKFLLRADEMGHVLTHPPAELGSSEIHPFGDFGVRPLTFESAGDGYVESSEDRFAPSGACLASGHLGSARQGSRAVALEISGFVRGLNVRRCNDNEDGDIDSNGDWWC